MHIISIVLNQFTDDQAQQSVPLQLFFPPLNPEVAEKRASTSKSEPKITDEAIESPCIPSNEGFVSESESTTDNKKGKKTMKDIIPVAGRKHYGVDQVESCTLITTQLLYSSWFALLRNDHSKLELALIRTVRFSNEQGTHKAIDGCAAGHKNSFTVDRKYFATKSKCEEATKTQDLRKQIALKMPLNRVCGDFKNRIAVKQQ